MAKRNRGKNVAVRSPTGEEPVAPARPEGQWQIPARAPGLTDLLSQVIGQTYALLAKIFGGPTDWRVMCLALLVAGALIGSGSLPPEYILPTLKALGDMAAGSSITAIGYVLALAVAGIATVIIATQQGRLRTLGAEVSDLRAKLDPMRASSRNVEALKGHAKLTEQEARKLFKIPRTADGDGGGDG